MLPTVLFAGAEMERDVRMGSGLRNTMWHLKIQGAALLKVRSEFDLQDCYFDEKSHRIMVQSNPTLLAASLATAICSLRAAILSVQASTLAVRFAAA